MAERAKKKYSTKEALEAIFDDEDNLDDQFDCGSNLDLITDTGESSNESDLDAQISQIISNLEFEEAESAQGMFITLHRHF